MIRSRRKQRRPSAVDPEIGSANKLPVEIIFFSSLFFSLRPVSPGQHRLLFAIRERSLFHLEERFFLVPRHCISLFSSWKSNEIPLKCFIRDERIFEYFKICSNFGRMEENQFTSPLKDNRENSEERFKI